MDTTTPIYRKALALIADPSETCILNHGTGLCDETTTVVVEIGGGLLPGCRRHGLHGAGVPILALDAVRHNERMMANPIETCTAETVAMMDGGEVCDVGHFHYSGRHHGPHRETVAS